MEKETSQHFEIDGKDLKLKLRKILSWKISIFQQKEQKLVHSLYWRKVIHKNDLFHFVRFWEAPHNHEPTDDGCDNRSTQPFGHWHETGRRLAGGVAYSPANHNSVYPAQY